MHHRFPALVILCCYLSSCASPPKRLEAPAVMSKASVVKQTTKTVVKAVAKPVVALVKPLPVVKKKPPEKPWAWMGLSRPGPPNILLIYIDTVRADRLGTYGYPHDTAPTLDAIARRGVVFEQARSTGPSTRFSVPPLLVGKYMTEIRRSWGFWPRIHRSEVLITEHLKKAGYTNAVVHSIDYFRKRFGMKKGFHHYDDSCIQVVDEKKRRRLGWMHCKWWVPTSRYVTRRVRRLVEQQKLYNSQPFFLWTYYSDPHGPYIRHRHYPPHGGFYEHRYDGEISYTDHHISHMLTSLEKRGMLKDTVIIISSDHGEGLNRKKDHGSLLHSANLFDELLHVPLIIAGPGIKPRRVKTVVSTLDIPSTMMDLAGLKKSPAHRGMSLVPYLKGQSPPHPPVFFEKHRRQDTPLKGMLDWPHKVIGNMKWKTVRVFNLETDPNERKPLTNKTMDATKRKALIKRFWHWVNVERKAYNDKLRH